MSLDVYLRMPEAPPREPGSGIFIRENGATREISEEEWNERFPDREPVRFTRPADEGDLGVVYERNITHNLGRMAKEAGIYEALWRPDEHGLTHAGNLTTLLRDGLAELVTDPERFKAFNPENGWGDYDGLVEFVRGYLQACERFPDAEVEVSR